MRLSVQAGGSHLRALGLLLLALLFSGCPATQTATPSPSPSVVASPIVVDGTPETGTTATPGETATPRTMVDHKAEHEQSLRDVAKAIEDARAEYPGKTGIVFVDIESDQSLEYDADKQFESASLMKLVVIAELYRLIQVGELDKDHPLTLQKKDIVGGSGDLKDLEPGMTFPVTVLAEKMITQSDNTATQMLTDFITREKLNESVKNLGLTGTTIDRDIYDFAAIDRGQDNYITAKDAALLMAQLAREELPGSSEIHAILERQQRNDMIGHKFPAGVRVAHKTGELNGIVHDVGVVYAPRGVYVLALLSDHVSDKEKAIQTWAELSTKILKLYQQTSPTPTPTN